MYAEKLYYIRGNLQDGSSDKGMLMHAIGGHLPDCKGYLVETTEWGIDVNTQVSWMICIVEEIFGVFDVPHHMSWQEILWWKTGNSGGSKDPNPPSDGGNSPPAGSGDSGSSDKPKNSGNGGGSTDKPPKKNKKSGGLGGILKALLGWL